MIHKIYVHYTDFDKILKNNIFQLQVPQSLKVVSSKCLEQWSRVELRREKQSREQQIRVKQSMVEQSSIEKCRGAQGSIEQRRVAQSSIAQSSVVYSDIEQRRVVFSSVEQRRVEQQRSAIQFRVVIQVLNGLKVVKQFAVGKQ